MAKKKHIKSGTGDVVVRSKSLTSQIENEHLARKREKPRATIKKTKAENNVVNEKLTKRILKLATKQREEISDEEKETGDGDK